MDHAGQGISELLRLETELNGVASSIERAAKINLLKYLQVLTVKKYETVYTGLFFKLRRDTAGFDKLRTIEEKKPPEEGLLHPMEEGSIEHYLLQAEKAKLELDKLVEMAVPSGTSGREAILARVKSQDSTERKIGVCGGIRHVTDLARATIICDTPTGLADVFEDLKKNIGVSFPYSLVQVSLMNPVYSEVYGRISGIIPLEPEAKR